MAVIIKIRERLGTIIVILIGAALGIFVLETALNSNSNLLKGNKDVVGTIDGEKIKYNDYITKSDEYIDNYKKQVKQDNLDEATTFALRDQTWSQLVNDKLNEKEFGAIGIAVPFKEMEDLFFSANPHPQVKQSFTNPQTGLFDPNNVKQYVSNLDKSVNGEDVTAKKAEWLSFEKGIKQDRLNNKYTGMIKGAMYVPKWLAEMDYNEKNTKQDIQFIMVPYTTVSDSDKLVEVTDQDLIEYMNARKDQYKQKASRSLEFVTFKVLPSSDDTAAVKKSINDIYANVSTNNGDTTYIKLNADKGLDKMYYAKDKVESYMVRDSLFKVGIGTTIGPYFENGDYKIAYLMDRKDVADSVRARHILVRIQQGSKDTLAAYTKADSILKALQGGADFNALASKYTEDEGSKAKNGELGFIAQGRTVTNFNNYLFFGGKINEYKLVKSEFGYHIIQIEEFKNIQSCVRVAFYTRKLEYSNATDKSVFDKARNFATTNNTKALFDTTAAKENMIIQNADKLEQNAYSLSGISYAREIVQWAFGAKVGDVSNAFALTDQYVVAVLTDSKEEGMMSATDARPTLEQVIKKEKKGNVIAAQLASASVLSASLDALAIKFGQPVKTASSVSFSNGFIPEMGQEPKVVGAVSALKQNELSKPIEGVQGVFVVVVTAISKPQPIADYSSYSSPLLQGLQSSVNVYSINEALKKDMDIEDLRYKFF